MTNKANHGGGKYAQKMGNNRKTDKRYDARAIDYNKTVESLVASRKDTSGYHKPGARKKVY